MHALRRDILSSSGGEFAVALNLTAKNLLRVYAIREQLSPISIPLRVNVTNVLACGGGQRR